MALRRPLALAAMLSVVLLGGAAPAATPVVAASGQSLPADVAPPLSMAAGDKERAWREGCVGFDAATQPRRCVYGDPAGNLTIALVGDSHLSHLFGGFEAAAQRNGWRLLVYFKINCPFIDMPVRSLNLGREYTECATWNRNVVEMVNAARPDLVVTAWYTIRHTSRADSTNSRKAAAVARMLGRLSSPAAILADSPVSRYDVPACLSANEHDIGRCATPRRMALRGHATIERLAARRAGVPLVSLARDICVADPCPAVVNRAIVYRDSHHLTNSFATTLGSAIALLIKSVL